MAKLSAAQIMAYAKSAGLTTSQAIIATAIAFAESGGNPTSRYNPGPEDSYGLWQINLDPSYKASRMRTLGISSPSQLFDPATNARAMYILSSHGSNWRPWTTYTSGKYKQFVSQASGASASTSEDMKTVGGGTPISSSAPAATAPGPLQGIADLGAKLLQFTNVKNVGLRTLAGVIGFLLICSGLIIFAWGN